MQKFIFWPPLIHFSMHKSFVFPAGTLTVSKSQSKNKPALKLSLDSVNVSVRYTYETIRDRAFDQFENRNALAVYNGMLNMIADI
jgi:hypothetical protein